MAQLKAKKMPASIGEKLKKAREDKGISLDDAHKATKIHSNVLQALEEDRLERLLGKTYVKSFLKKYTHYLGLNAEEIIEEYNSKYVAETAEKPILGKKPVEEKKKIKIKVRVNNKIAILFALVILISILSIAAIKFVNRPKDAVEDKIVSEAKEVELKGKQAAEPKKELIPIPKSSTITLTISTNNDVWLKVTRDGELTFHGILPKNSKETWQADKEIMLSEIGRPEVLELNVNGKFIDFSKQPLRRKVLITREGIDLGQRP